mgnify:FL=1
MRHVMSPLDFSVEEVDRILDLAADIKANPEKYPVAAVNYTIFDDAMILPAIYNIREQVKYVNETVWSMVVQTENLSRDDLMAELKNATDIATELSEM